jgi:uncharacterized protein
MRAQIRVEIVYAIPRHGTVKSLKLPAGSLVSDALRAVARCVEFAAVDLANAPVGIFGKLTHKDQTLEDGDRIEIYRPLILEPKAARRARVSKSGRS